MAGGRTHKICPECNQKKSVYKDFKKYPKQPRYYAVCLECQKTLVCLWCGDPLLKGEFCATKAGHKNCSKAFRKAQVDAGEIDPQDSQGQTARVAPIPKECDGPDGKSLCAKWGGDCFETSFRDYVAGCYAPPRPKKQIMFRGINPQRYL